MQKLEEYLKQHVYITQDGVEDVHDSLSTVTEAVFNFLEDQQACKLLTVVEAEQYKDEKWFNQEVSIVRLRRNRHYLIPIKYLI